MAKVVVENLHLHFPVHNASSQSLQLDLYRRLGGRLAMHDKAVVVEALRGVSFSLEDGARVGIIGSNGAGKTTLLRAIAGVYPPSHGTVRVEGKITPFTDLQLGMDMEATGYENIIFRSVFLGLTFEEARARSAAIAEFSELKEFLNMPVRTYSQGMFLRLAFAISTSIEPEIMIMDELIGGGDQGFTQKARQRVDELASRTRILVLASHNVALMKYFCDRVIWLEQGTIREFGPVDDVTKLYSAKA